MCLPLYLIIHEPMTATQQSVEMHAMKIACANLEINKISKYTISTILKPITDIGQIKVRRTFIKYRESRLDNGLSVKAFNKLELMPDRRIAVKEILSRQYIHRQ